MHALEPSNICLTEYLHIELFKFKKEERLNADLCDYYRRLHVCFSLCEQWTFGCEGEDLCM